MSTLITKILIKSKDEIIDFYKKSSELKMLQPTVFYANEPVATYSAQTLLKYDGKQLLKELI